MELYYSGRDLDIIKVKVEHSIKALTDNGTIIGEEHNLIVIKKLIEENKQLRDELVKRVSNES